MPYLIFIKIVPFEKSDNILSGGRSTLIFVIKLKKIRKKNKNILLVIFLLEKLVVL